MASILIADDHAVVRMAVRILLESAGHNVIGEVNCGLDVIEQARIQNPELIILDIDMPKLDGIRILKRLRSEGKFKVLVFSGLSTDQYAIRCARGGASAFVSKKDDMADLLTAVHLVQSGYKMFPTSDYSSVSNNTTEEEIVKKLSAREVSVLRYLALGYRVKDIAEEMLISEKTASTYKSRLIVKLQVSNSIELVELAKRNGLT